MSRSVKITTIPLRGLPNYCWIRKAQGNYELHAPKDSIHSLPKVLKKYKPVLDELGLGYREVTGVAGIQFLEYWNPEHYKKKELCLHEYAWIPISKGYYDTRRSHKEMVLDNETYKKAGEIQEKVEKTPT